MTTEKGIIAINECNDNYFNYLFNYKAYTLFFMPFPL